MGFVNPTTGFWFLCAGKRTANKTNNCMLNIDIYLIHRVYIIEYI